MTAQQLVSDIRAACKGDSESWERLLMTYRPALESWASTFSINGDMSQRDLVQEAWLQVWKGLGSFRGVEQPDIVTALFYQWLRVTARNAMLTCLKHRNAKRRLPDKPVVNGHDWSLQDHQCKTPSSIVSAHEQALRLQKAIEELPEPLDRQIVSMVTEDGLSLRVVSNVLGRDYSTIRRRFHGVLSKLETKLNPP